MSSSLPASLGALRASGYRPVRVKDELRRNLLRRLRDGSPLFPGLVGYDETVVPELVRALLARHDILLLGTRGQGKTRLLRQLPLLLDEFVPIVAGSELRDDPLAPVSAYARRLIAQHGDETPIEWIGRDERYLEKLATPDVTVADLFGDIDLMKHVQGRSLAEEESLHFGLLPRANRGLFCVNELPDLGPRIQVGLFNVLQERDVQIRGFPVRFSLDLCLLFSANPEDYTGRGRLVTPLKDRIGSVIRTHYPRDRAEGVAITDQAVRHDPEPDGVPVVVPRIVKDIIEEVARIAREHPSVNQQSGVSARLAIAGRELVVASAENRAIRNLERMAGTRIADLAALRAGARGKLELLLVEHDSGEDRLIGEWTHEAIGRIFRERVEPGDTDEIRTWFAGGGTLTVSDSIRSDEFLRRASRCPALVRLAEAILRKEGSAPDEAALVPGVELILEGLHLGGQLNKRLESGEELFSG